MNFRSDTHAPAAPEILAALTAVNEGSAAAYGEDQWSRRLDDAFSEALGRKARVFTVVSGTAANAISIASLLPQWGAAICHREAHIEADEAGAPEFFSGGGKLVLTEGAHAKVTPDALEAALKRHGRGIHSVAITALSISQATERGASYRAAELAALSAIAKRAGLALHMDGARFANSVAFLGCAPGEACAGVDLLSFGATKNGALAAEAVVAFDDALAEQITRRRKRGGHLLSKGRFVAAQLLAYLEGGLWLRLAARANEMAARVSEAAAPFLSEPVESNQVFIKPGVDALARLRGQGFEFYDWGVEGAGEARLVVSWNQNEADVAKLCAALRALQ